MAWSRSGWRRSGDTDQDDNFTDDAEYVGVLAGTRWQAFARTRIDFDARWYERSLEQGDVGTVELSLALVRNINPQLEARLAGTWTDQTADTDAFDEFDAATGFLGIVRRLR